jgi:hypothetical protein
MAFRQQQPVIPGVLDQSAPRLHQSLLQARGFAPLPLVSAADASYAQSREATWFVGSS